MRIFNTGSLSEHTKLTPDETSWIYNGLDCCVTLEVRDNLRAKLADEPPNVQETYATALRKIPPVLSMTMRGLRRESNRLNDATGKYTKHLARVQKNFDLICDEVLGYPINWRSPVQLKQLFYTTFGLSPVKKRNAQGIYAPTVNREALEKFSTHHYIGVFARHILTLRDMGKKLGFLKTDADADGRVRTNLNIAGTDTGRFASSFSVFGSGTNLQNVEDILRGVFCADPGMILVNVDLEQADARNVGARLWQIYVDELGPEIAGKYLDACESGDLHTTVCSMAWRELDWPEPWDMKAARAIADQNFYREMSYRDGSKRLGHGTNYFGQPFTMAMHTKTDKRIITSFQERYFSAFPLIGRVRKSGSDISPDEQNWHAWVLRQLRDVGYLNNLFGRRRLFFDRWKSASTLRAAIAYDPQSSTGEFLDRGWLQLWDRMPEAQLLVPVHDSILFQVPYEGVNELVPQALEHLRVTLELKQGRLFSIPLGS